MAKAANPLSVSLAQGGGLWCGCWKGQECVLDWVCDAGLRAWERLADPTHPISLPLAQKLQGNHFLAAFPPPL